MKLFHIYNYEEEVEGYSSSANKEEFLLAENIEKIYNRKGKKKVSSYWIKNREIKRDLPCPKNGYGTWIKNPKFNFKKDIEKIDQIEMVTGFGRSLIISEEQYKTIT